MYYYLQGLRLTLGCIQSQWIWLQRDNFAQSNNRGPRGCEEAVRTSFRFRKYRRIFCIRRFGQQGLCANSSVYPFIWRVQSFGSKNCWWIKHYFSYDSLALQCSQCTPAWTERPKNVYSDHTEMDDPTPTFYRFIRKSHSRYVYKNIIMSFISLFLLNLSQLKSYMTRYNLNLNLWQNQKLRLAIWTILKLDDSCVQVSEIGI